METKISSPKTLYNILRRQGWENLPGGVEFKKVGNTTFMFGGQGSGWKILVSQNQSILKGEWLSWRQLLDRFGISPIAKMVFPSTSYGNYFLYYLVGENGIEKRKFVYPAEVYHVSGTGWVNCKKEVRRINSLALFFEKEKVDKEIIRLLYRGGYEKLNKLFIYTDSMCPDFPGTIVSVSEKGPEMQGHGFAFHGKTAV